MEDTRDAWQILGNREGDLSRIGPHYTISQSYFETTILPSLNETDSVILLFYEGDPNMCIYFFFVPFYVVFFLIEIRFIGFGTTY